MAGGLWRTRCLGQSYSIVLWSAGSGTGKKVEVTVKESVESSQDHDAALLTGDSTPDIPIPVLRRGRLTRRYDRSIAFHAVHGTTESGADQEAEMWIIFGRLRTASMRFCMGTTNTLLGPIHQFVKKWRDTLPRFWWPS